MAKSTCSMASSTSPSSSGSSTCSSSSSSSSCSSSESGSCRDKSLKLKSSSSIDRRKRLAANARERKRMHLLNKAYDGLRRRLVDAENKSKYDVLVQAKEYIQALATICEKFDRENPNFHLQQKQRLHQREQELEHEINEQTQQIIKVEKMESYPDYPESPISFQMSPMDMRFVPMANNEQMSPNQMQLSPLDPSQPKLYQPQIHQFNSHMRLKYTMTAQRLI